jgi:hypothetical protein
MSTKSGIHLYWATGCTSCLRVKEYLERNDVPFVSHNVVNAVDSTERSQLGIRGVDQSMIDEMADLGLPDHVPIVRRGEDWADGKDLSAVAELVGVDYDAEILPVEELARRVDVLLEATLDFLDRIPEDELGTHIPNRPRSYGEVLQHIFSLPDVFIMHEAGVPMDGVPRMEHSWEPESRVALATYGRHVADRWADWFDGPAETTDWSATADVFWGQPTKHEFLERTTWHTGQHVRQIEWILAAELDRGVGDPLNDGLWEGLPMPEKVWNEG